MRNLFVRGTAFALSPANPNNRSHKLTNQLVLNVFTGLCCCPSDHDPLCCCPSDHDPSPQKGPIIARILQLGLVAQWITRLTTDQKIPGSNPGKLEFFKVGGGKGSEGEEMGTALIMLAPRKVEISNISLPYDFKFPLDFK